MNTITQPEPAEIGMETPIDLSNHITCSHGFSNLRCACRRPIMWFDDLWFKIQSEEALEDGELEDQAYSVMYIL